jgi:hypothetical protein
MPIGMGMVHQSLALLAVRQFFVTGTALVLWGHD